ncbi:putative gustatory receptor 98b [Drosophila sulfurigaster albostrigata]|uniref:putative gustatory receptor 98b n=1 Tax=Drosophila sulfurigaster albostrigata TaxID=89887 RepID=UPI002D21C63A|nr:putative gustatory receptor 98b [Drosophila sulfurigaster albostrigata]
MEGQLLATSRPYLQLFSLLTLTPPPSSFGMSSRSGQRKFLLSIFSLYSCCIQLISVWVTFINVVILAIEVQTLEVTDFTNALGLVQKIFYTLLMATNYVYIFIYYGRLGDIYREIAALEKDIDGTFQSFGSKCKQPNFRIYMFKRIGLWAIFIVLVLPRLTIPVLTDFMSWRDRILTEFIIIVLEFKSIEYTLYVFLIRELLRRLRHKLLQLQRELSNCEQRALLQALCQAMRRNKQLLGRIWLLVGQLEGYFLLPMLLIFLYNGVCVLHIVNWAYIQALNPNDCCRFYRVFYLLILLTNLLIPCYVSHNCISLYNSFGRILHNIRCGCGRITPQELSMVVMEYALQLEHLKLRFTCGGFFDINLKYFGGMVVTIISFTIILIQFKLQALLDTKQAATQRNG